MPVPPQIAWMLGAATGCIVSTAGMNLVFRNPKTGIVRECSLEEITSLEKLDASEIDIAKLGKEVPTDDLELYMRYQKEGSIEHFTDSEKKTISRIETMGITGDECEEILRARGREVTRPQIEEPEAVLPLKNESEVIESGKDTKLFLPDEYYQKLDANIAKAIEARDAEIARIKGLSKTQQSNVAAVVAGVDLRTGEVYVGVKNSRVYKGNATCAEDIVFRGLGGNTNANIIMTPSIRPRNNEVIPVCTRCQTKYPKNQFVKGTTFQ